MNQFARMKKTMKKHWPNAGHNDSLCGAWGTWKIPMGGMAPNKKCVTCRKCRKLLGLAP